MIFHRSTISSRVVKLLSAILAFYILLLTGVPCCAYDHCEDNAVKIEHTKGRQPTPKSDKDTGCNSCSPFFSCHGCCGFIIADRVGRPQVIIHQDISLYNLYRNPYYSQFVPFFWQPPDIV